jgi:hypothetical protein
MRIIKSDLMTFQLSQNREVQLQSIQFKLTYDGIFEGNFGEKLNHFVLNNLDLPSDWKDKAICIDTPKDLSTDMPGIVCMAQLSSVMEISTGEDLENNSYSELRYIWFIETLEGKTLREIVQFALDKLDWDEFAEEFELVIL